MYDSTIWQDFRASVQMNQSLHSQYGVLILIGHVQV